MREGKKSIQKFSSFQLIHPLMNVTYHIKDVTIIILQVCLLHRSSEDMVA